MKDFNDIYKGLPEERRDKIDKRSSELRQTILERLEQQDQVFFEGNPNSSDRDVRKAIAQEAAAKKHNNS